MEKKLVNFISPNFTDKKLENPTFEDLVDVFEDRILNWILVPSRTLLETEHGYYAAVGVLLTYFEGIQCYINGETSKGKSKPFFIEGFESVFSSLTGQYVNQLASTMYSEARCGFFHEGLARKRIFFSETNEKAMLVTLPKVDDKFVLDGKVASLIINPNRFYFCVKRHFDDYLTKLRDINNIECRKNFQKFVDLSWKLNGEDPIVGMTKEEFLRGTY